MNNAQKKAAIEEGFSKYLSPTPEYYYYDSDYKDKLLLSAYLQGWNDAEDAHEGKPKKLYKKCDEVGCSFCDEVNE
jgi:hypothetical protein